MPILERKPSPQAPHHRGTQTLDSTNTRGENLKHKNADPKRKV